MASGLIHAVLLPLGLGLLGFVEPCTIGSSLLFVGYIERNPAAVRVAQALVFTVVRALAAGGLGVAAVLVGTGFAGFQRAGWITLGGLYVVLGTLHLFGRAGLVMRTVGPSLARMSPTRGAVALAVLFGLNLPACAAPLLGAILGAVVVGASTVAAGFLSLALFGLALSLPLLLMVLWPRGRRLLDRMAAASERVPVLVGVVLVAVGLWSIYFGVLAPGTGPVPGER